MRLFVDMDGVVVDFDGYCLSKGMSPEEVKKQPGAYLEMLPIPGAIEAVRALIGMGYDVYLASKPPTGIPWAYADKVQWVLNHLPELSRKIILTSNKGLLGNTHDVLLDDRLYRANCHEFSGTAIQFRDWKEALELFIRWKEG